MTLRRGVEWRRGDADHQNIFVAANTDDEKRIVLVRYPLLIVGVHDAVQPPAPRTLPGRGFYFVMTQTVGVIGANFDGANAGNAVWTSFVLGVVHLRAQRSSADRPAMSLRQLPDTTVLVGFLLCRRVGGCVASEQAIVGIGDPKQDLTQYMQYSILNSCPRMVLRRGVLADS